MPVSRWQHAWAGIHLVLVTTFFDLLILPPSFISMGQVICPFLYFVINNMLLGREFVEIIALRCMNFVNARKLRRKHGIKLFVSGIVIALLFAVPLVNCSPRSWRQPL